MIRETVTRPMPRQVLRNLVRALAQSGPRLHVVLLIMMGLGTAACPAPRPAAAPDGAVRPVAPAPSPPPAAGPSIPSAAAGTPVAALAPTAAGVGGAPAPESPQAEEGDGNPRSAEVVIRLLVEPPKVAHVHWGVKDLGLAPLEIRRPRGSGPLDVVLRAPGYLAYHTRLFTDRDDRLSIRLVPVGAASGVFGYRREEKDR